MKKRSLIVVEWYDVSSFSGWMPVKDSLQEEHPFEAVMVGWELGKNKEYITLATAFTEDEESNGRRCIPRGCIKSIRRLE